MRKICFGMPSMYRADKPICRGCSFHADCGPVALGRAKAINAKVDVSDVIGAISDRDSVVTPVFVQLDSTKEDLARVAPKAKVTHDLTIADKIKINRLPKKVAEKLKRLLESNADKLARESFKMGRNPFPIEGSKQLHVACELLLRGGFSREELRQGYIDKLGWSETTAFPSVTTAIHLLTAMRLIEKEKGRYVILPEVLYQN
jgi:hypothetical protein